MALVRVQNRETKEVLVVDEAHVARWPDDFKVLGEEAEQATDRKAPPITADVDPHPRRDF